MKLSVELLKAALASHPSDPPCDRLHLGNGWKDVPGMVGEHFMGYACILSPLGDREVYLQAESKYGGGFAEVNLDPGKAQAIAAFFRSSRVASVPGNSKHQWWCVARLRFTDISAVSDLEDLLITGAGYHGDYTFPDGVTVRVRDHEFEVRRLACTPKEDIATWLWTHYGMMIHTGGMGDEAAHLRAHADTLTSRAARYTSLNER